MSREDAPGVLLEHLFRRQAGRMVARLTRLLGPAHVGLAEEAVQDAMVRALETWPYQGAPPNPGGWLFRVAHNLAIDSVRRRAVFGDKTGAIVADIERSAAGPPDDPDVEEQLRDDELRMIVMCCHPALSRDARVALSLKVVGGFGVREIARAFMTQESTIAQRLVRAKRQLRDQQVKLEMPAGADLSERLDSALEVLYLIFNEGYAAAAGADLTRQDLCFEALRLGRLVAAASIATPTVHALVALMALQAARLPARVDTLGDLVPLEEQDRDRWDRGLIALGFDHFDRSMAGTVVSEFHIQAAIAATYARAVESGVIDWPAILQCYDDLLALNPSPVIALNRAVAVARVYGPGAALPLVDAIDGDHALGEYYLLLALRGQLLLDLGRHGEAADALRDALDCVATEPERRFLSRKLAACTPDSF